MNHMIIKTAIAATALISLAACGQSAPQKQAAEASAKADEAELNSTRAMLKAEDGSGARAVKDMMTDPNIQDQLGVSGRTGPAPATTAPTAPVAPPVASAIPPVAATTADGSAGMADASMDSQVSGLALCRAMKAARGGGAFNVGPAAKDAARRDLAADPQALAKCQNG